MMRKLLLLIPALLLSACATGPGNYGAYLEKKGLSEPESHANFQHCSAYGCQRISDITLPEQDWREFELLFTPPSTDATQEKRRIAQAIGLFEQKVGPLAGTDNDMYGTFKKIGVNQHDCVDESTNTTIYLALLKNAGFMRFHDISAPDSRIPLIHYSGLWPHQTAAIAETQSGDVFAVDSWFHDNGYAAEIVPMEAWKSGWKPEEHKRRHIVN